MRTLKISLVKTGSVNSADFEAQEILNEKFEGLRQRVEAFPYSQTDFIQFSFNDEANLISKDAIAAINPAKYLLCKQILGDQIIPILAVRKSNQADPYYPAFFIANKDSTIHSIRSDEIKRVYAVDEESASGYIAPIYKLWESGVIPYPGPAAIKEKGWELTLVGKHTEVENRVIDDPYSIGMTGQFSSQNDPQNSRVKPILRYYYLPQDVLVISRDLMPFREAIEHLLLDLFALNESGTFIDERVQCFGRSSNRISGFTKISDEFINALDDLKRMMHYLEGGHSPAKFSLPTSPGTDGTAGRSSPASELKELIAEAEEEKVMERLIQWFDNPESTKQLNEMVMLKARYKGLAERQRMGIVADDEYNITLNQIRKSLIDIIDDLPA